MNPSAVIADGFGDGLMPGNFGTALSDEQINTIVAWLIK
jgi:hypothetical protein